MYRPQTPEASLSHRMWSDYHSSSPNQADTSRPASHCLRSSSPDRTHKYSHSDDRQHECKAMYKGRYFHSTPSSCCDQQGHSRSRSGSGSSRRRERGGSTAKGTLITRSAAVPALPVAPSTANPNQPHKVYVSIIPMISKYSRHHQSSVMSKNSKTRREPLSDSNNNNSNNASNIHSGSNIHQIHCYTSMDVDNFGLEVDGHGIRIPSLPSVAISSNWRTAQPQRLRSDRNIDGDRYRVTGRDDNGPRRREGEVQVNRERSSSLSELLN